MSAKGQGDSFSHFNRLHAEPPMRRRAISSHFLMYTFGVRASTAPCSCPPSASSGAPRSEASHNADVPPLNVIAGMPMTITPPETPLTFVYAIGIHCFPHPLLAVRRYWSSVFYGGKRKVVPSAWQPMAAHVYGTVAVSFV
ncbi:hypothetical protein WOLCODRAFT_161890 [Wolfiporia cocos MD-104 SS10]|uniref:Uncharacterized protein n=1 Tax=Wolfiporia cocos (strain MD-104) TaxID=742152 RepID=A0A2H3JM00_WOLCO|nr:hypothetical protein WOLCODRAFT_161890 [Wolfiporia cocos MD-104 SS10]